MKLTWPVDASAKTEHGFISHYQHCRSLMASSGLALAVLLFTVSALTAAAAPAPYGAYLGCYDLTKMGLSSAETKVRSRNYRTCPNTCASARASLVIVGGSARRFECRCGFSVPPSSAVLPASSCNPGGRGVAVFYRHAAAETQQCRVFEPSTAASNFRTAYNTQNARYADDAMRLTMNGLDGGTRVHTTYPMQRYGQFQVRGQIPCGEGVISAFYLRSTEVYPNPGPTFDEIDFEFISFAGQSCSIWLNSWKDGDKNGETQYGQAQQRQMFGWPSTKSTSSWVTYTIDWQPGYVSWYVDGKLLQHNRQNDIVGNNNRRFQVPSRPMRPTFSLWTDLSRPYPFGGIINPAQGPWTASYQRMRQIVCDTPAPATTPLGPAWMYA